MAIKADVTAFSDVTAMADEIDRRWGHADDSDINERANGGQPLSKTLISFRRWMKHETINPAALR
jgi:hypothetical protein